jgi:hypothetical protein
MVGDELGVEQAEVADAQAHHQCGERRLGTIGDAGEH